MPTSLHELLVTLFRNRPGLAPELLRDVFAVPLPTYAEVRIASGEIPQAVPPAYHADLVVLLVDGKPVFAIVIEVQLRPDERKRRTWPHYATSLRARLDCPTCVLVITPGTDVAEWCAQSIDLGVGNYWRPLVVGPDAVPLVRDPEQAKRDPELAVLSVMAHAKDPANAVSIATAAAQACRGLEDERGVDVVLSSLPEAFRKAVLEELMLPHGYEFQSDFARRYVAEGEAKGKASAVLNVLEARGRAISAEQRERIRSCTDLATLDLWTRRAVSVSSTDELFAD